MTARQQLWAWFAVAIAVILFLWTFQAILLPFVAGLALAYILDPLADRFERFGAPRWLAATLALLTFFSLGGAAVFLLAPVLNAQLVGLADLIVRIGPELEREIGELMGRVMTEEATDGKKEDGEKIKAALQDNFATIMGIVGDFLSSALRTGMAVFNVLALLFVTPIVAFYMLRDWDRMVARLDALLPRHHAETIRQQLLLMDRSLSGFVRGQALVCITLGFGYGLALMAAGLEFGFMVGLLAGLLSFIPYVGSMIGLVASVGLAFVQFDEFWRIAMIAAIFGLGQAIEGNVLTPIFVGDRVGLHPVWIIFALFAGGILMGFVGLLLAVPIAAVVGVLARFMIDRYRDSRMFEGDPAGRE